MNMLLITGLYDQYPTSGGAHVMKLYVEELRRQGHTVVVLFENTLDNVNSVLANDNFYYLPTIKNQYYADKHIVAKAFNRLKVKTKKTIGKDAHPYFNRDFSYLKDKAAQLIKAHSIDVIQVDFPWMISVVDVLPNSILRVFVSHELQSRRFGKDDTLNYNEVLKFEAKYAKKYDAVLCLTPVEKEFIDANMPGVNAQVSTMGVYKDVNEDFELGDHADKLVFVGSGKHFPNLDAITYFCADIWPQILKNIPAATVYITGEYAHEFKNSIGTVPGLVWAGFVDDLQQFMINAISIVPVRLGSGIRIKILDSMRMGAPVVATQMAAEGIASTHGEDMMLSADANEFVAHVTALWNNKNLYCTLQLGAKKLAQDKYELTKTTAARMQLLQQLKKEKNS